MTVSVAAILAESAGRSPEHPAIVFGAERVTYRELWRRARSCAAVLRAHGVGPGARVALLLANTPHFPAVYFGTLALGAVPVPVNVLLKPAEIAYVLADSGAVALVTDPSLVDSAPGTVEVLCEELLAPAEPIDSYVPRDPGDLALVLYTSGTTGRPKGAMLSQLNIVLNVGTTMRSPFDFGPDDVLLGALPLSHAFGQVCGMLTCFAAGATMVLMPRFDGPEAIRLMVEHGCTVFMGVPTMYRALLDAVTSVRPTLDRVFSGGAALPVEVLEDVESTFGCRVYEGYGLTETSPVVAYNQKAWPSRPGTVGKPIWGVRVAIADPEVEDSIELLRAGEPGEVVISGHNVMMGYLNRPEATAEVLVDGWLRSGDVGVLDDEGYLRLVDRKKDMVVRGGYKVYPREVEDVLVRHPKIAQAAVIGVPHERHGEEVWAMVVPRAGVAPGTELARELVAWGKERLAAYKYPRRVEFVTGFPLGPSGKVLKRELHRSPTHDEKEGRPVAQPLDVLVRQVKSPADSRREFLEVQRIAGRFPAAGTRTGQGDSAEISVWCSNDYLAMGQHPKVLAAMKDAIDRYGGGSGGSRNISGTNPVHHVLERELAELHGKEQGLLFVSGYSANDGALTVLASSMANFAVFSDEKNHASIIDGLRHSGAEKHIFRHNDVTHLRELIAAVDPARPKLIVLESVYSMSGDIAPLAEIADIAREHDAVTFLDEVHAVGMYGPQGAGIAASLGIADRFTVIMGTLAKGFGTAGGYIAGPAPIVERIRDTARPFIFTTSLPPAIAAGALAAVRHLRVSDTERRRLSHNADLLHTLLTERGIPFLSDQSHIVSAFVADDERCKQASALLLRDHGIYVQPINAPSVPAGEEILRVAPSAAHTAEAVHGFAAALDDVWRAVDIPRTDATTRW